MNLKTLRHNLNKRGLRGTALFYAGKVHALVCVQLMRILVRLHPETSEVIVFKNDRNTDYSDNTKALYDYLIANRVNERYRIVWCVSDPRRYTDKEKNVRYVAAEGRHNRTSFRAFFYGATARYFFFTHDTAGINRYRVKNQTAVNLTHGNGYKAPKTDLGARLKDNYRFDYLLVSGPLFVEAKMKYWSCPREKILPLGFPRYDLFHRQYDRRALLCALLDAERAGCRIVLWLPTFLNNREIGFPEASIHAPLGFSGVNSLKELEMLDRCCAEQNTVLIIKKHPAQADWCGSLPALRHVVVTDNAQLADTGIGLSALMCVSDALLTDFSSAAVDYLLLDRPIGFVLSDLEAYGSTRGYIFENPCDYMPGEKLTSAQDIARFITQTAMGKDHFASVRAEMRKCMHNETACYCDRIAGRLGIV